MKLSRTDRLLLNELQRDATRNQSELAELVGMSRTSCWRRIRDFEEAGLIERQVALLNPKIAGFNIQVLLLVAMTEHTDENRQSFERHVSLLPEVTECFSVSGDRDYVLHVVVKDMDTYNEFLNSQVLKHSAVRSASSTFVLRRVKYSTVLPLEN
ncbi:MAG: winged helix-turn-helix transcriptional regulator [Gammaproteobacteria bacterium]|jgi:Lrp/AsnC family transcriptional regulator|nr:winged helix-turn-helix transcriptional regulator [Gammaproteobacteria bacterium]